MRAIALLAALPLALAACSADGRFVSPQNMTPAERCANAELVLALMESNGVGPATLERAKANVAILCAPEAG